MALLTPMSLAEAQAIGAELGLEVIAVEPIPHGSVNSNFRIDLAGGGRAFLRVCEESGPRAVEQQNRLLMHLVEHGVPTPAPLPRRDGGTIGEHRGKPVTAFAFCEGHWICQARVDEARVAAVGRALAQIHLAGQGYLAAPANRFGPAELRQRVADLRAGKHGLLSAELAAAVERLAELLDQLDERVAAHPATTVVHGDVFRDNVLWTGDGRLSAVLDFESASRGHAAFDWMVTMLAWCFGERLEQRLARALLAGYREVRPLEADELDACYDEALAAAVRFAITRITDYELRPRGVVVYKDYRRFLARLDALQAIGRAHFVEWLAKA